MDRNESKIMNVFGKKSYLWLVVGSVGWMFANGNWIIPIAAWISLTAGLRFTRERKPFVGYAVMVVVVGLAFIVQWHDAWKDFPGYWSFPIFIGIFGPIPFLMDKLFAKSSLGFLSTLIFPLAWTTGEFINSFGLSGTVGSLAYTQFGNLPLIQLVSVTGLYGITFLITWFASVFNYAWEQNFEWVKIRRAVVVYASVLALVLVYGGVRLEFQAPKSETTRFASVVVPGTFEKFNIAMESHTLPPFDESVEILNKYTKEADVSGAEIIVFHEYAFLIDEKKEKDFVEIAVELVKKEKIHLFLAMGVFGSEHGENKVLYLKPTGEIAIEYLKRKPVFSLEAPYIVAGEKTAPAVETPFGKISAVICADLSYNHYIRSVAKSGAAVLIGPSIDWEGLVPWNTQLAVFRAIENGFSLVRANGEGLSIAVDPLGQTLAAMNTFNTKQPVMIADVPVERISTIYSFTGELFGFLCAIIYTVMITWLMMKHRAAKKNK